MAITRIQNNQITDSSAGNVYLGVNAASKVQDYSVTGGKLQNNLTYGSDFTITGNLTVQGNTTTIDTVNLTVEDPLILLAKEQTGAPTLDIGYIGKRGTETNIAFVWDESADEFATTFTSSENTNTTITISSYASLRSYDVAVTGNLSVSGTSDFNANVTMGNITFDSGANVNIGNNRIQNVAEPSSSNDAATKSYVDSVASSGFDIQDDAANTTVVAGGDTLQLLGTANQVSVLITGNDQVTFALTSNVSVAGNVTGGNILTAGLVSATGNVTGNYILGNGAFLTGVDATQIRNGTSNVSIPVANGNVEITVNGVADMVVINQNGGDVTGYWSVSGNVTGGNVVTAGQANVGTLAVNGLSTFAGNLIPTANITYNIGNSTNRWNDIWLANSTIYLGNAQISANATAINLTSPEGGTAAVSGANGDISTGGFVSAGGNITGANMLTGGVVSSTGNVTGGNVLTGGLISATGNATASNMLTGGVVSATGNVTGGNLVTAGVATVTGNVIGGNITTAGLVTATGNVTGGNVLTGGIVSATGNLAGNNVSAAGFVSATGNIDGLNVNTAKVASSGGITIQSSGASDITLDSAGNINADNNYLNNVLDPVQNQDAATKLYVDTKVSTGISYHEAVVAATTANLATTTGGTITYNQPNGAGNGIGATITTTGSFNLIDTANVQTANTRILVKDEGNAVLNGIYVWSNATVITRSTDADTYGAANVDALSINDYFFVQSGNVNKGSAYIVDAPSGTITFGTSNIAFALFSTSQTYTANTQAGLVLNGTIFSAKVDNDTTAFDGGGNIIVKAGANLVTPNIGAATGTSLSVTGTVTAGNLATGGTVSATGNVTAANILTGGIVSATGNITGSYFLGNGSQLSGVTATAVDANNLIGNTLSPNVMFSSLTTVGNLTSLSVVGTTTTGNLATGGTVSATGNITGGNVLTGGLVSATGNVTGGNVITIGLVSATGNVTGGNLVTSGIATITGTVTAGNVDTGGTVSATGNVTGGNLLTGGLISAGGNVTAGNLSTGIISATGNINGTGAVFSGNVSAANFIGNISGNIDAAGSNTEVQFNNGDLLGASSNFTFDTATNILTVTGTIQGTTLSATGNVIGGNVSTAGLVTATGNVTGGNVTTAGLVTATGNVTGGNIITGGYVTATGNATAANVILTSGTIDGPAAGRITINGSSLDTDFAVNGDTVANILYIDAGVGTTSFGNSGAITNAIVSFNTTDSILLPKGTTAQRPSPATVGMFRFNTTSDALEVYNSGTGWITVEQDFTVIVADSFTGNGVQTIFTLSEDSTTAGTIVSINGVVQIPTTAYSVSGNALTFTEAPSVSDTIDARILTTSTTVASLSNASGNATVTCLDISDTVQIEGNLLPSANITYNLGSNTAYWNDLYLSGNTIYLGSLQLQASGNTFVVYTADGTTQANIDAGSIDVSAISSGTSTIGISAPNGNAYITVGGTANVLVVSTDRATVTGDMSVTGNVTAQDVNSLSDAALKVNIQPLSSVDNVIRNLKGVEYDWKNGSGHSYGFLAQEVEQILPNAVKTGSDGLKAINYQMIIPFLVETIKDMGDEIKTLKTIVHNMNRKH